MLPGDPNLPPGVSERHFDSEDGEPCDRCEGTGYVDRSACCRAPLEGQFLEEPRCPECNQLCRRGECRACDGRGSELSAAERREQWLEDKADQEREDRSLGL